MGIINLLMAGKYISTSLLSLLALLSNSLSGDLV